MKAINVPEGQFKIIRDGLVKVHPGYISVQDGFNIRQYFDGIPELAQSLIANGQDSPIIVRRDAAGDLWIVAGERRWRAAQYANAELILENEPPFQLTCIIQDLDDDTSSRVGYRENFEREGITPADLAGKVEQLKSEGMTYMAIGERLGGISEAAAIDYGKLARLPAKYLKLLHTQPRLKSALIELLRLDKKDLGAALSQWAVADKPTWGLARDIVRSVQERDQSGDFGNGPAPADADVDAGAPETESGLPAKGRKAKSATSVPVEGEPEGAGNTEDDPDTGPNAAAVDAAMGKKARKPPAVLRFRTSKEIVRFLESIDHPLAVMLVKHAQGKYSDKLATKKWTDILGPVHGEAAEG